jgi:hypothetical protein
MLEESVGAGAPILQVAVGRFKSTNQGSTDFALALLQPRSLMVFAVVAVGGTGEEKEYFKLNTLYQHTFERTAYNFCFGPFDHVQPLGRQGGALPDEICVQSMDGCLQFVRQEVASFRRFLPGALLPGPLIYAPSLQAFITASSQVRCGSAPLNILLNCNAAHLQWLRRRAVPPLVAALVCAFVASIRFLTCSLVDVRVLLQAASTRGLE